MTERKPAGLNHESWIDKQIREATERGEFADLPGAGKPIPRDGVGDDEHWWLKNYLRKEGVGTEAMLPPSLLLRRDIERLPDTVRELDSEPAVRTTVAELNQRVVEWMRAPSGPQVPVSTVDADEVVTRWRAERAPTPRPTPTSTPTAASSARERAKDTRGWWRRLARRG
ncbi:DnaJ family domain-containing protein [Nocardia callitridis]|uniref:DnaJ homologue subfamily C member 28 conserved domain-containing protein n=1 Tax=Nocardia callitridis TaxID=648753 RepID=A0ABP9KWH7_9NOCA